MASFSQVLVRSLFENVCDTADTGFHFRACRYVCCVHDDFRWLEVLGYDLFLYPKNDVVTGSMGIIAKVMVETQMCNTTSFQQFNDLFWPTTSMPSVRGWAFIVKVDFQFCSPSISPASITTVRGAQSLGRSLKHRLARWQDKCELAFREIQFDRYL